MTSEYDRDPPQGEPAPISWVFDHAPAPTKLLVTLFVIAFAADAQGRGSAQPVSVIAKRAGKSPSQIWRDIKALREMGLLVPGDQSLVGHLPEGQRPTVYDLPLHISGPKPMAAPKTPRLSPGPRRSRKAIRASVRNAVLRRDGYACVKCESTEDLTLDHVHPWALGGDDTEENLQTLCRGCNSRKGAQIEVGI